MTPSNRALRESLRAIGQAKAASDADGLAFLRELAPGERMTRAIELSESIMTMFPPNPDWVDDEAETWARVNERLARLPRE